MSSSGYTQFLACARAKQYDTVTAGETCTIATAQKLKIFDKDKYVADAYQETQTYSKKDQGRVVTAKLCNTDAENASATPLCQLEYGPAFTRKAGTADACVVLECPPGFESLGSNDTLTCKKPKRAHVRNKAELCEERFYDWYTVPNYYLGNGTYKDGSNCYGTCPAQHVPYRKKDPMDKYKSTLTEQPDLLNQCIHKTYYMSARYSNTPEYSPLAWIKRLTTTPQDILNDWKQTLQAAKIDPNEPYLVTRVPPHADEIYRVLLKESIPNTIEDLYQPGKYYLQAAAAELDADKHGFKKTALEVAKSLRDDEEAFLSLYRSKFPNLPDTEFNFRIELLKQACTYCFCDPAKKKSGDNVCFKVAPYLKKEDVEEMTGGENRSDDPKKPVFIEDQISKMLRTGLIVFVVVVFTPVVLYVLYRIIRAIFWGEPADIVKTYKKILRRLRTQ